MENWCCCIYWWDTGDCRLGLAVEKEKLDKMGERVRTNRNITLIVTNLSNSADTGTVTREPPMSLGLGPDVRDPVGAQELQVAASSSQVTADQ